MKMFFLFGLFALLPCLSFASDFTQQPSVIYPYQSTIEIQDDFMSGGTTSGTLGTLGWSIAGGVSTTPVSTTNRIGLFRKDTSAVAATVAYVILSAQATNTDPAVPHSILWIAQLNNNDVNTTIRLGAASTFTVSPPAHGIYIEKLDADTNFFCVTRAANVQTRTDSGVAVNTSFNTLAYTRNSSGVQFVINGALVCSVMTTNIPTSFINPGAHIVNSAAAAKTIDLDYFQMKIQGLVR